MLAGRAVSVVRGDRKLPVSVGEVNAGRVLGSRLRRCVVIALNNLGAHRASCIEEVAGNCCAQMHDWIKTPSVLSASLC